MRYCGHFLIKAEGGAKNYERDHPLPLAWRSFTVAFVQRTGTEIMRFSRCWHSKFTDLCYKGLGPIRLHLLSLRGARGYSIASRHKHQDQKQFSGISKCVGVIVRAALPACEESPFPLAP